MPFAQPGLAPGAYRESEGRSDYEHGRTEPAVFARCARVLLNWEFRFQGTHVHLLSVHWWFSSVRSTPLYAPDGVDGPASPAAINAVVRARRSAISVDARTPPVHEPQAAEGNCAAFGECVPDCAVSSYAMIPAWKPLRVTVKGELH